MITRNNKEWLYIIKNISCNENYYINNFILDILIVSDNEKNTKQAAENESHVKICNKETPEFSGQEYVQIQLHNCLENQSQSQLVMNSIRKILKMNPITLTGKIRWT